MTIQERILQVIENKSITPYRFCKDLGLSMGYLDKRGAIGTDKYLKIIEYLNDINPEWLLTGKGDMLKSEAPVEENKNLIPLYDDVATIGGTSMVADTTGASSPNEYIDAGDWFSGVTAAIRHYGDSMAEYPNGCILALRQLHDNNSIVWGRNYVVETNEIRVTKRLQTCRNDDESIMAYSTNTETYPDGQLVHEPFKIKKEDIRRVFLVLGRVVKEYSSDPVFTLNR